MKESNDEKIFLNLGAGSDIKFGFINHDIVSLPGIDVVHNLNVYPWPWENNSISEIYALDLLEHLDDFILAMEEIYRILKFGGKLYIKVPYWNSSYTFMDPTHKRGFHENTFHFFDPSKELCQLRYYYSNARFYIDREAYILIPFAPYLKIPFIKELSIESNLIKRIVGFFGNLFSNIILDLKIEMIKTKNNN